MNRAGTEGVQSSDAAGAVTLCWLKQYSGKRAQNSRIMRSRVTLAMTLAAAMLKLRASPPTSAVCAMGKGRTGKPSIRT